MAQEPKEKNSDCACERWHRLGCPELPRQVAFFLVVFLGFLVVGGLLSGSADYQWELIAVVLVIFIPWYAVARRAARAERAKEPPT